MALYREPQQKPPEVLLSEVRYNELKEAEGRLAIIRVELRYGSLTDINELLRCNGNLRHKVITKKSLKK